LPQEDDIIDSLILNGAVEVAGLDIETGDALYTFTDKLSQFSPALHRELNNYFYSEIMFLWENGFLDMDITSDEPSVSLTEKALDEAMTRSLDKEHLISLKGIINALRSE
jgi:hypothetical protein